jgi:type IV pilus assembly protein PilY1
MKSLIKKFLQFDGLPVARVTRPRFARIGLLVLGLLVGGAPLLANATQLSLSNSPLFLSTPVPSNIFFLLDDSGSMDWNMMTIEGGDGQMTLTNGGRSTIYSYLFGKSADGLNNNNDNNYSFTSVNGRILPTEEAVLATPNMPADAFGVWRGRYAGYNHMYYNPEVIYKPWEGLDSAGVAFADAVPTAVRLDPYNAASATVDVTQNMTWTSDSVPNNSGTNVSIILGSSGVPAFYPAMYYLWTDDAGGTANGVIDATDTHTKIEIKAANEPFVHTSGKRTDCVNPLSCTYTEEMRNFANWFSYYRRRVLTAKNAAGKVVAPSTARMGFATLHDNGASDTRIALMNQATNTGNKKTLLDGLYKIKANLDTPLRTKFDATGKYFQCASGNIFGDAASSPGSATCPILSQANGGSCQQNFSVVMTDGYYNDTFSGVGNQDGDTDTVYDGGAYADSYSNTLADIAQKYYEHDLQSTLTDNVPVTPGIDNNTAQHLVTYTAALGVNGTLTAGPTDPTAAFAWPDPSPSTADPQKIDDLRHAAYDGRGLFLSAQSPDALVTALSDAIASITDRTGSAATVAVNSRTLSTTTVLYQARFTSGSWSGDLQAIGIDTDGNILSSIWSAGDELKTQDWDTGRNILTFNGTSGIPFRWNTAVLSATQQTVLNTNPATGTVDSQGKARLNYLRGSSLDEGTNNNYRVRSNSFKLGDIVNSSPIFVGAPIFMPDLEAVPHSTFRATYLNRPSMVYVGANDGMLHGFDATTGLEKIAYVPGIGFSNLNKLTDPNYIHQYFVDGSPTSGDVFGTFSTVTGCPNTGCWRTALVGALGAGGKGYFALDVTDPTGAQNGALAFNEANAANIALWEFTDSSTPNDMGYSFSQATIAKMHSNSGTPVWAAIFGNGYNSVNERPVLYIVNAVTGALIKKIILDSTTGGSNGLSTPAVVDQDGDFIADYIYAGDLKGNMWKIDVTNPNSNNWDTAYKSGSTPIPVFVAVDGSGNRQPITERPEVGPQPDGLGGFIVYFGTGRYIVTGDQVAAASPVQTFYGIWDNGATVTRADLLPQTMGTATVAGQTVRSVTNTTMVWRTKTGTCNPPTAGYNCLGWRTDLLTATSGYIGEMSVSNPILLGGVLPRVIFTTLIPDSSACTFGGSGWLLELNPRNGGQLSEAVFDLNGDGVIDANDMISGTTPVAGINPGLGIMPEPVILRDPAHKQDLKISTGSTGAVKALKNFVGKIPSSRQSWRQLK